MRGELRGQIVVVMGASSGIGLASAEAFARRGAKLVLAARSGEALAKAAESCRDIGAETEAVTTDVTDAGAVRALAERAVARFGRIDVWVSNVGVGAVGRFHEVPIDEHAQVVRASLVGHMNDAHAVLPIFLRQGRGVFINMVSLGGYAAIPFAASYSAAKFGLRGFADALRAELADHPEIHVCDIYPAFVDTPALSRAANHTGARLSAPPPVIDPRTVARKVVETARYPRARVPVGIVTNAARLGYALSPGLMGRAMHRFMDGYLRRAEPVERKSGNLFAPPPIHGGVEGGLRSRPSLPGGAGLGLALVAGLGVLALLSRTR